MSDIFINPTQGPLAIKIQVTTLQDVGYDIQIVDKSWNTIAEFNGSLGPTVDYAINAVTTAPDKCINAYINSVIEIGDPSGADNDYNVIISVMQNGNVLTPTITLSGKTTINKVVLYPQFHINLKS